MHEEIAALIEMPHAPDPATFARMRTAEMRAAFLIDRLFENGAVRMYYAHQDRAVIGGLAPAESPLALPNFGQLAADYFTQRRELGVINVGGPGRILVGAREFRMAHKDMLYIGRENRDVVFVSDDLASLAQFYLVSYPAHAVYPCAKGGKGEAQSAALGSSRESNERTIHRIIHPQGIPSCQLTMGFTELAVGSVWNTMPAHTHARRSEIYFYFDLPAVSLVVHCMGEAGESRHILVRDRQAVVSPNWSVHFGAGTANYSFVWAMGGENQQFADMDPVPMATLG